MLTLILVEPRLQVKTGLATDLFGRDTTVRLMTIIQHRASHPLAMQFLPVVLLLRVNLISQMAVDALTFIELHQELAILFRFGEMMKEAKAA